MFKDIVNNKIFKSLSNIVEIFITVLLIVLIILTGFQRFSNSGSFFGYRIFTVATGSMIPMYNIGDTLLVKNVPIDDIQIGDAVTYETITNKGKPVTITHEVIDIDKDEFGELLFHTKGIANNVEDPIVEEKQVVGKVIHKFFFLSFIGYLTTNKLAMMLGLIIPIAILVAIEVIKLLYDDERKRLKALKNGNNVEAKYSKYDMKALEKDKHILTDEERQKKIEAIRNGTSYVSTDKNKKLDTSKPLSQEEIEKKIEKIKNSGNGVEETKHLSDIIKSDNTEEINFDSISDRNEIDDEENVDESVESDVNNDNKEIKEDVLKNINNSFETEEELDEILKQVKEKLLSDSKNKDLDKEE